MAVNSLPWIQRRWGAGFSRKVGSNMDDRRFDSLARTLAGGISRRRFIGGLVAAVATTGLVPGRRTGAQVTQAQCGNKSCANNPGKCNDGCVCCVYPNGSSRCRPPGACAPGEAVCSPGEVPTRPWAVPP